MCRTVSPLRVAGLAVLFAAAACSSGSSRSAPSRSTRRVASTTVRPTTTTAAVAPPTSATSTTAPATTTTVAVTTTTATVPPTSTSAPSAAGCSACTYVPPVAGHAISYAATHHDYPAADIFATGGCGATLVAVTAGTVVEARRTDTYVASVDDPDLRGGRSVSLLGADGVRYYYSHLASVAPGIGAGVQVASGQALGVLGRSGDASACHVHFGISPNCPAPEWKVRRGVVWPQRYLDAWRAGTNRSPRAEVRAWLAAHPSACADAARLMH